MASARITGDVDRISERLAQLRTDPPEENLTLATLLATKNEDKEKENATEEDMRRKLEQKTFVENWKLKDMARKAAKYTAFRESLPIFQYKTALLDLVKNNQVIVVMGETGSGKTTQITQYLLEAGYAQEKKIGCTQPRRVAAKTVAKRVSLEVGTNLGDRVGYKVRFDNQVAQETAIVYMTDGLLVRELCSEPNADTYSVIMLDEAHERSINTDVAMGLLKEVLKKRKDLKVLVTSATLDSQKFSKYFDGAPILTIPGKVFPVEIKYATALQPDYLQSSIAEVIRIHRRECPGDILVFLTGADEIDAACDQLAGEEKLLVLPLYSALPWDQQSIVFDPTPDGLRKVVLATNLAETSVTIDGIVYVVDPGFVKQREYSPRTGIDNLVVKFVSKAQAIQRAGRAGRTRSGKVYRLYSLSAFNKMVPLPVPEIQRVNVESVILQLGSMGITDIMRFHFMDSPSAEAVTAGLEHLMDLLAFQVIGSGSKLGLELTQIGREMCGFPLEPALAKVLMKSHEVGCSEEILTIVALLSAQSQNIFSRPKKRRLEADLRISKFHQPQGDHITLLEVYNEWTQNDCDRRWCRENFVQFRALEEAKEIRGQLACLMTERKLLIVSCFEDYEKVQESICSGFFRKLARKAEKGHGYMTYGSSSSTKEVVYIYPSSALFKKNPKWVIYHELVKTKQAYMRHLLEIQPRWIRDQSPLFFKKLASQFYELVPLVR